MDDGEVFVAVAATVIATALWYVSLRRVLMIFSPRCPPWHRAVLLLFPIMMIALLALALSSYGPKEVRENAGYVWLFCAVGATSMGLGTLFAAALGVDFINDSIERANPASLCLACGVWLAIALLNLGSNLGNGDSIITTLYPLTIGLGELGLFLLAVAWQTGIHEAVSTRRSVDAGVRYAAMAVASALPVAKAASGDWASFAATNADIISVLPTLLALALVSCAIQRAFDSRESSDVFGFFWRVVSPASALLLASGFMTWRPHAH